MQENHIKNIEATRSTGKREKINKIDKTILVLTYILVLFGIFMIFSASSIQANLEQGDSLHFLKRQVIYVIIGTIALIITTNLPYIIYKKLWLSIFGINIFLLIITYFAGVEINGARRWINLKIFLFQPSEFSKFAIIVTTSFFISRFKGQINRLKNLFTIGVFILLNAFFILIAPSFSAAMIATIPSFVMLFIGGLNMVFVISGIAAVSIGGFLIAISEDYRLQRILSFTNPFNDTSASGWQISNSLMAISSGGIGGLGFGKSTQKYFYISQPHNDFIFAVIAEELGLIGCIILLLVYSIFIFKIFRVFILVKDVFGKMLVAGIGMQIGLQILVNIAVATSLVPNTGAGLPFISYGGTSIIMFLAMIGVVLNVSKHRRIIKK